MLVPTVLPCFFFFQGLITVLNECIFEEKHVMNPTVLEGKGMALYEIATFHLTKGLCTGS